MEDDNMNNRFINKKYQVFISSTYLDLIEERKKVIDILLSTSKCIPIGMELFSAEDEDQFNVIKEAIDMCDFYVLLIGNRYGSVNTKTDLSYTEMEYDYAVSKNIPVLVFAIDEDTPIKTELVEEKVSSAKLTLFRRKAMRNRLAVVWKDINMLGEKVAISIMKAIDKYNRPGWIRGDASLSSEYIVFPEQKAHIHSSIEEVIRDKRAKQMKVICYGASFYGRIIEEVIRVFNHIEVEVIVYSPFGNYWGLETERKFLEDSIKTMVEAKNVSVYLSEILPTIRASLVRDRRNKPLFCTSQPYYIFNDPFAFVRGDGFTPSIVADEGNTLLLKKMQNSFMSEFNRLKGNKEPTSIECYEFEQKRKCN